MTVTADAVPHCPPHYYLLTARPDTVAHYTVTHMQCAKCGAEREQVHYWEGHGKTKHPFRVIRRGKAAREVSI